MDGTPALHRVALRASAGRLALLVLAFVTFLASLSLAVQGIISSAAASVIAPAAFIAVVISLWQSLCAAGLASTERPLIRRHGFWLVMLLTLLTLPRLGGFGLIDPWESHYAEVAREMLARGDFISAWWAHQSWFMSKPVLTLWLEALSMSVLGAASGAGQVLVAEGSHLAQPEWAVRLPGALFMQVGCYVLYRGVAASAGRKAGFLAGVVLATAAQWALSSRHALTDTPFAAALTASFGFLLLGWNTPEGTLVRRHQLEAGRVRVVFDASLLLLAAVLCAALPQLALLFARHVEPGFSVFPPHLRFVADTLAAGSPGNCGLPSQPACAAVAIAHPVLSPALQALGWGAVLFFLIRSVMRERRLRRLLLLAGWYCMGLATMSKGIAGFALPLSVAATYLLLEGPRRELWRAELVRGGVLLVLLVLPWYLAVFARHGRVIIDELVLRHMLGRALDHLHDTNVGEDVSFRYYVWQLGYAMFPWIGWVPAALFSACAQRARRPAPLERVVNLALLWLVITFGLFTFMRTKFHHYILPAVPALAILTGVWLAEAWQVCRRPERHRAVIAHVLGFGGAVLVAMVGVDLLRPVQSGIAGAARLFHLLSYQYGRAWPSELDFTPPLLGFTGACCLISLCFGSPRLRRALIIAQVSVAITFAGWLVHCYLPALGPHFGQRHVIEAFYRDRASPDEPLIAYQLNWKGENFYTGNHLAIFVASGKAMRRYLHERVASAPVQHFVLERRRLAALRAELGPVKSFELLTDERASDKICLVRVRLK